MNLILERINEYRKRKQWTEYRLAEESGIAQSTISSWYRKDMIPTVDSLRKISSAFGIPLAQMLSDNDEIYDLSEDQLDLLKAYNHLKPDQREALISFLKKL